MNLGDLQTTIADRLNIGKSDVNYQRITQYIDETYREILTKKGIGKRLRQRTVPFVTIANNPIAALPQAIHAISNSIVDRTNRRVYTSVPLSDIRYLDPGQAFSSSAPYSYAVMGMSEAVVRDPVSALELYVNSDSALDTGGINVQVQGITSDGQTRKATVTLAGTANTSVDSTITTWILITKFFLTAQCRGTVSLYSSDNVVLSGIAPGHTYARFTRLYIYPTPTTAAVLYADVELAVSPLVSTYDEPIIDEDFYWLIISGSLMKEYAKRKKFSEYDRENTRWIAGIRDLRSHIQRPTSVPSGGRSEISTLGAMFPADNRL